MKMEKKEMTEQITKLMTDNPAKFIKIRDIFEDMFGSRDVSKPEAIGDQEYKRLRYRFQDIDVPFSWCDTKDTVCQLYMAIDKHRSRYGDDDIVIKKTGKSKKKGLFVPVTKT